jgi:phage tail-like protein
MKEETGFKYLNTANKWPTFQLNEIEIAPDGSLTLKRIGKTFASRGVFRGGPFETFDTPTPWFRLQVFADPLPDGTHLQLFTFTADAGNAPYQPAADEPFAASGWMELPRDVLDVLIPNPPAQHLWIGAVIHSDGSASPLIRQLRVDYGCDSYLKYLPAIYGEDERSRDFLERFLSLFESMQGGLEEQIDDLPLLFDASATRGGEFPSWLSWLAGWLAFDLDEAWNEPEMRRHLAQAFALYGQRGTVEGLRQYLKWYAGLEARIEEPGQQATIWSLGENSTLGITTALAPAQLAGAVVGTTSTLGRSHLTHEDVPGAPLFDDVAHRFCVQVYCAELTRPGALEAARAVLEREKPAHTDYHLCVIEPRLRVGAQARVGIDAIVAQGASHAQFDLALGTATLAQKAEPCEDPMLLPEATDVCESEEER